MKYSFSASFRDALIATVMTAIVVTPVFSLHLERAGMRTNIVPDWRWTIWACIAVFVVQMLKPLLAADVILCTDGEKALAAVAKEMGITHRPINLAEQEAFRKAKEPNRSYPYDVNFEQK